MRVVVKFLKKSSNETVTKFILWGAKTHPDYKSNPTKSASSKLLKYSFDILNVISDY